MTYRELAWLLLVFPVSAHLVCADLQSSCLLGQLLGAIVRSWSHPCFMTIATIGFLASMLLRRWRWVFLTGVGAGILPLVLLFAMLTDSEEASILLTGRVLPTLLGGVIVCSIGWLFGRLLLRLRRDAWNK